VPKDLRIVPALPTTGSGKVVRHNLTVRDEELVSQ
jgi:acyl-coenzyme A synthetase/AMP-(fatty) acid ligase